VVRLILQALKEGLREGQSMEQNGPKNNRVKDLIRYYNEESEA